MPKGDISGRSDGGFWKKEVKFDESFCKSDDKKPLKAKENHDIMGFTGKGAPLRAPKVKRTEKRKEKS